MRYCNLEQKQIKIVIGDSTYSKTSRLEAHAFIIVYKLFDHCFPVFPY